MKSYILDTVAVADDDLREDLVTILPVLHAASVVHVPGGPPCNIVEDSNAMDEEVTDEYKMAYLKTPPPPLDGLFSLILI